MNNAIYAAATGSRMEMSRLDIIANNLANAGTAGFKEDKPYFRDVLQYMSDKSFDSARRDPYVTRTMRSATNHSGGALRQTGNDLDVAISGDGFFVVEKDGKEMLTRNGAFRLDGEGRLCTGDGGVVMGEGGEIVVGEGALEIDSAGNVMVDQQQVDKLRIEAFEQPAQLKKSAGTLFVNEGNAQVDDDPEYQVQQGALEQSNVNPVKQMTQLIEAGRNFEAYQKIIKMVDETNQRSASALGKIG